MNMITPGKENRISCKVCSFKFVPYAEKRYEVCKHGIAAIAGNSVFEAFDCPLCGCQNIVGIRELRYEEPEDDEED